VNYTRIIIRFFLLFYLYFIALTFSFAQDTTGIRYNCPVFLANTLSTHPFGIFISRINSNFQIKQDNRISFVFNIANGNDWWPYVKSYTPTDPEIQQEMSKYIWHERENHYDKNSPAKTKELTVDGTFRFYKININFPVAKNQEIKLYARGFSMDNFHVPYIVSDEFIEWFHNHISMDGDVFGRQEYGYDHLIYYYKDENDKKIILSPNQFYFLGVELAYYYYPEIKILNKYGFFLNIGGQLGVNTTDINPTMDLGINSTITKRFNFKKRSLFISFDGGILRQKLVSFKPGVIISNRDFIYSCELLLTYRKKLHKGCLDFTTTFYVQSSYFNPKEFDYIVLTGKRRRHWNHAILDLYHPLTGNSFMLSYSGNIFSFSIYLREDLKVDNAPDAQVGAAFKIRFK